MELRNALKKEIIRMNTTNGITPDWVIENINKLIDRAIEILEKNNADKGNPDNIYRAAFMAVDECF